MRLTGQVSVPYDEWKVMTLTCRWPCLFSYGYDQLGLGHHLVTTTIPQKSLTPPNLLSPFHPTIPPLSLCPSPLLFNPHIVPRKQLQKWGLSWGLVILTRDSIYLMTHLDIYSYLYRIQPNRCLQSQLIVSLSNGPNGHMHCKCVENVVNIGKTNSAKIALKTV